MNPTETPTLKEQRQAWIEANPLRRYREKENLSMLDVASTLGVSGGAVQLWEYGTNQPDGENLAALVALTGDIKLPEKWGRWIARRPVGTPPPAL